MPVGHFEILVEEPSMEAFLSSWVSGQIGEGATFAVRVFQGKNDLLKNLDQRLRAYRDWLPPDWRIIIIVDRDNDDCIRLKGVMEDICINAGLSTRRTSPANWNCATCLAIEELEAWYFGDWAAVTEAYPRVSPQISRKAKFRFPDAITGGTWEAFERTLQGSGYFRAGLEKIRVAREVGSCFVPARNTSESFRYFLEALRTAD